MKNEMTGRERVKAALTFNNPDRVPRDLWALPYVTLFEKESFDAVIRKYPMDIGTSQLSPGWSDKVIKASAASGSYRDDWGSEWQVGEPGVVGEVKKPALYDWDSLKSFQPPWNLIRKRDLSYANKSCEESDKFMLSDVTARPFERLQFLRGTENLFMDIAYDAAEMRKLLEMVHEFYLEDVRQWCASSVDAVFLMDDWGTNRSLLIDPKVWRALFKPLYKEYCDMIHSAGKFAFFHTDGNTESIFGDLVEVGMDAINSQLFVMNIEELSRKYRGKVTFWGEVDRQHVLPFGTKEEVQQAVRRVKEVFDGGKGGVIAQCEWGKQNPRQNIETVFETWQDAK
jgi:hypothetical protein